MKNIFRIARIELSLLCYSPVAWIVLLVFIIQAGWQYTSIMLRVEQAQQMGQVAQNLTDRVFAGFMALFPKMQEYLYLYIPLLTMGLISRETHSGSIKLLYSSPIRMADIVAGKYLAMVTFCFILIGVLFSLGIVSYFSIENVDFMFILSGILGLYLLICAYSAIGLFMSSLTSYQVVAAISTLVVLAVLNFIGTLWQNIPFVRDITYFLSINGRAEESIHGLIGTNDVAYFLIVIILFLGLTLLKLEFERRTISLPTKMLRYFAFIAVMLLIGYLSSRPQFIGYIDMTENHRRTLTPSSRTIVEKFDEPVVMTTYVNLLDENYYYGLPGFQNNDRKNFDMYFRFMPDLTIKYVHYWDHSQNARLYAENPGLSDEQIARKMAKATELDFDKFLRPEQIKKIIDLTPERNRLVRVLSYKGKKTMLRMFDDLYKYPGEKEVSAALKRLIVNPPRVGFLADHRERNIGRSGDQDYKTSTNEITFRYALINQGFQVGEASLDDPNLIKNVDILVIADPLTAYSPFELSNLTSYIKGGGNLMIAAEPGSGPILNAVLSPLNIKLADGMMVQKSQNFEPSFVMSRISVRRWTKLVKNSGFIKADSGLVTMPTVSALEALPGSPFEELPILTSRASDTWKVPSTNISKSEELFDTRKNGEHRSYPLALALRRQLGNTQQRIFVVGDADFMSNAEMLRQSPKAANFTFLTELFGWFSNGEFPIDTTRTESIDNKSLLNNTQLSWMRWILLGVFPGLIALLVSWMLISRKRR